MNPLIFFPALALLIFRASRSRSLTPLGIASAILTACAHGIHPWNLPFLLLITFYTLGTAATKVKHDVKARITLSSTGAPGGEGARTATQVFANSAVASVLTLLHAVFMREECFWKDVLVVGIIANYAAVTADTLSSELGILSRSRPRLITTLRPCTPGTNGGVSAAGVVAGAAGAAVVGVVSVLLLPFCRFEWTTREKVWFVGFIAAVGLFGSVLDSVLGALLQESVVDVRTGKVVEAPGGGRVLVTPGPVFTARGELRSRFGKAPQEAAETLADVGEREGGSRKVVVGSGLLSNNGVNFVMAAVTSAVAMAAAGWWWI